MKVSELLLRKNNNLDLIRILLAALVIIGHAQFLNGPDSFFPDPLQSIFYFTYSGAIAVKLFFFISGLVVANSLLHKGNISGFLISRIFRLMPALILVLLVTVLVFAPVLSKFSTDAYFSGETLQYLLDNLYFKTRFTLPGVFTDNNYPNTVNGSLWSLRYEVACYLFMLAVFIPMRYIGNKFFYNIPVLLIIGVTLCWPELIQDFMESKDPERWLLPACFAFGVFFAVNADKIKINIVSLLIFPVVYLFCMGTIYQELAMIFALSVGILYLSSRKFMQKLKPKYDISYGIYLWGFLIQQTLFHYLGHINILLHIAIALVIASVLAFFTYVFFEKPGMELGKHALTKLKLSGKSLFRSGLTVSEILPREKNNLDLMRILLTMLVVIGHTQFLNGPDSFFPDPLQSIFYFTYSAAIAVKLFFFISGMVVTNSLLQKRDVVVFFISRIFRLMPALILVLLVTVLVFGPILTKVPVSDYFSQETFRYFAWNLYFKTRFTLPGVFTGNLYPNTVNGSLWSLRFEVGCYLFLIVIFAITMWMKNKYWYNIPIVVIILCTILPGELMQHLTGSIDPERFLLPASFAFGVFFAVNADKIKLNAFTVLLFPLVYLFCSEQLYQEVVMIFAMSVGIVWLCSRKFMLRIKPKYDISYGIYLWAFLIAQTLFQFTGHINILLHIVIVAVVSIICAFVTYISVEKPGMDFGKKLSQSYLEFARKRKALRAER